MNNFISEKELQERRKKREEEWEKVRKPGDPEEMPEEPYDPRSLYEQLQEQKDKKQFEFEESIKFKNQFRGVNKDEVAFLDQVANQAAKVEKQINDEIKKELEDFRKARSEQAHHPVKSDSNTKPQIQIKNSTNKRKSSQSTLLMTAVKRKKEPTNTKDDVSKQKVSDKEDEAKPNAEISTSVPIIVYPSARKCVGILPGIGSYSDDSDTNSENWSSTGSESEEDC